MRKALFSKTSYIKGMQCLKALYLYKHHYKLRDPLSEERRERFNKGHSIGFKARGLFPGGVDASPVNVHRSKDSVEQTGKLLESSVQTIYEAAFQYDQILVYGDILHRSKNKWYLYEVKSSERISEVYKEDLALQYYVLRGTGLEMAGAGIIHLRKHVDEIDDQLSLQEIFQFTDLTEFCDIKITSIKERITAMKEMIAQPYIPDIPTGNHCQIPYPCEFVGFCNRQHQPINEGLFSI